MQINIYCLMTNQMPVLLEQRTPWMWAAVMLGLLLYFSHLPPPTTLNPDTCPLITYMKPKWMCILVSPRSWWSYEKNRDCEQSKGVYTYCGYVIQVRTVFNVVVVKNFYFFHWTVVVKESFFNPLSLIQLLYRKLATAFLTGTFIWFVFI